jgi:hypothetical protein
VAAVALLYAAVRRVSGPGAALLAGTVFALTPVAALMFRYNNRRPRSVSPPDCASPEVRAEPIRKGRHCCCGVRGWW